MNKVHKNALIIAVVITTLLFAYDYTHDPPAVPYKWWQHVVEFVVFGSMYVAILWGILLGVYFVADRLSRH